MSGLVIAKKSANTFISCLNKFGTYIYSTFFIKSSTEIWISGVGEEDPYCDY